MSKRNQAEALLARYLKGRPDSEKAAVLKIVTELGIEPNDPLWAVLISVHAAVVLLQDSPAQLNQVCTAFQVDLDERANAARHLVQSMAAKTEALPALSQEAAELRAELYQLRQEVSGLTDQVEATVLLLQGTVSTWQELTHAQMQQNQQQSKTVLGLTKILKKLERQPAFLLRDGSRTICIICATLGAVAIAMLIAHTK